MAKSPLLPGVTAAVPPPAVVIDAHAAIRRARFHAIVRDAFDVALLVCVDVLFLRYPHTHIPLLSREDTVGLLLLVHALFIAHAWAARAFPRWRARRVAATWCAAERMRLRL